MLKGMNSLKSDIFSRKANLFLASLKAQNFSCSRSKYSGMKIPNPSQDPQASSKAPNQDLKDMDVLCTFKIKTESHYSEYGWTKDQWPYLNQYRDAKPQSGTSSILQSPKSELKRHGSLHLQNEEREPKFRIWVNQRPVTINTSISGCKFPVGNL